MLRVEGVGGDWVYRLIVLWMGLICVVIIRIIEEIIMYVRIVFMFMFVSFYKKKGVFF